MYAIRSYYGSKIEQTEFNVAKNVTMSFGISTVLDTDTDENAVFRRADSALYLAKTVITSYSIHYTKLYDVRIKDSSENNRSNLAIPINAE